MTLAILAVFSVALTLLGFVLPPQGVKRATLLGLALALASLLLTWGKPFAFGPYAVDGVSQVFTLLALLGALWTVGLVRSGRFEFYLLVLYAALGMHLLASTRHLLLMLVALEALSLPLYALATWRRGQGLEAALPALVGAVDLALLSAVFLIFGLGLFELFIHKLDLPLDNVLLVKSLADLKSKLGQVIVMILVVKFFEKALAFQPKEALDFFLFAGGVALLAGALWVSARE